MAYGYLLNLREVPLAELLQEKGIEDPEDVHIVINRTNYKLTLYDGKTEIKSYKASFGKNRGRFKKSKNDNITPVGSYRICKISKHDIYYKYLQLDYPNNNDASENYKRGNITREEFEKIVSSQTSDGCPDSTTVLGSGIGIHGLGKYDVIFKNLPFVFNWTNGSVALSNENIDEIISITTVGTKVEIIY